MSFLVCSLYFFLFIQVQFGAARIATLITIHTTVTITTTLKCKLINFRYHLCQTLVVNYRVFCIVFNKQKKDMYFKLYINYSPMLNLKKTLC